MTCTSVFAVYMENPWLSLECPVMTLFRLQMCTMMSLCWLTGFLTSGLQCFLLAAICRILIVKVICFQSGISSLTESHAGVRLVEGACCKRYVCLFVCLFVLRFYGPVNPMGSCRARSVYLTTRLLGRLNPLSG